MTAYTREELEAMTVEDLRKLARKETNLHTPQGLDVWFPTDSDINEKYGDIKSSIENISLFLNRLKEREG